MSKHDEYVDLREFAARTGDAYSTMRNMVHSKELRPFVRQKKKGAKYKINWTQYYAHFETACKI